MHHKSVCPPSRELIEEGCVNDNEELQTDEIVAKERALNLEKSNQALKRAIDSLVYESSPALGAVALERIAVECCELVGAVGGAVLLYEGEGRFSPAVIVERGKRVELKSDEQLFHRPTFADRSQAEDTGLFREQIREHIVFTVLADEDGMLWPEALAYHEGLKHRSVLHVPMSLGERLIGSLGLAFLHEVRPDPSLIELLQTLAGQAALGVEMSRLAEESQRAAIAEEQGRAAEHRAAVLSKANAALRRTAASLAGKPDLNSFLVQVMIEGAFQVGSASVALFQHNPDGDTYTMSAFVYQGKFVDIDNDERMEMWRRPHPSENAPALALTREGPQFYLQQPIEDENGWADAWRFHEAMGHQSVLLVPLLSGERWLGFLGFCFSEPSLPSRENVELAQALADQAALAIELKRLSDSAAEAARLTASNTLLQRRDLLLAAVARVSRQLLEASNLFDALPSCLCELGESANMSRVKLFLRSEAEANEGARQKLVAEWCLPGITSQVGTEAEVLDELDAEWATEKLRHGKSAWWLIEEVPEPLRSAWLELGVKSTGVAPIFVEDRFIGALTFDDCLEARGWPQPEIDALSAAANAIGGALQARQRAEQTARERELTARRRVAELARANEALARSTARLAAEPNLDAFLEAVLIEAANQAEACGNALFLYEAGSHAFKLSQYVLNGAPLNVEDERLAIWKEPVPADLGDAWTNLRLGLPSSERFEEGVPHPWPFCIPWHRAMGHASVVSVPLLAGERLLGFMGLGFTDSAAASRTERISLAQALATQAVLALELTRLTAAVKENEARLTLAHDAADIGTWDWDLATNEVIWSPRNFLLWGIDSAGASVLPADIVLNAIHADDQRRVRMELDLVVAEGKPFRSEFRVQLVGGEERWLAGLGCHMEAGRSPGRMIGVNMDVSARRNAQKTAEVQARAQELARSHAALQRSVDRLASETDVTNFLRAVLEEMLTATDAACAAVFRYAPLSHTLSLSDAAMGGEGIVAAEDDRFLPWRSPVPADTSPTWSQDFGSVVRWLDNDNPTEDIWPDAIGWNKLMGFRYIALLGLRVGERKLGFLSLAFRRDHVPDYARVEHCGTLAQQAALAIYLTELADEGRRTAEQNATIAERTRLAAEIHDGLQQLLLASQLWIGVLRSATDSPDRGEVAIGHLETLLQRAVLEARRTVHALRPSTLDEQDGLIAALHELCRQTTTNALSCRVTLRGEVPPLAEGVQDQLYRIVQEAVSNSVKHARAQTIVIGIEATMNALSLKVNDDGHGTSSEDLWVRGFGLKSMRERAESIQGHLAVRTSPAAGFSVTVDVPL